jgi:hypothetical protein
MTTLVHQDSRGDFQQRTDRTLVSTKAFDTEFYTYTAGTNPATFAPTGVFSVVAGATATTCPAGRVLHLTGRKLYPDVNPMTTFVGTALTAKKFLVSVYDPISFLNGFIDPTSATFAKYDQNVPNFFNLGRDGSGVEWSGGGQGVGIHTSDAGVSTTLGNGGTFAAGNASSGQIVINGGGYVTVTSTAVTVNSKIFITAIGTNTPAISITSTNGNTTPTAGGFRIYVNTATSVNFLIVN